MKKILAVVLCICIVLTLAVSAMAESSPKNKVLGRKAIILKNGSISVVEDTWTELSADGDITFKADAEKYGKFNSWRVYKFAAASGTGKETYTEAAAGTDYQLISGSATSDSITIKPLGDSLIVVTGNYNGKVTDPAAASSSSTTPTSPKHGDVNAMAAVIVLLAAGALLFGAKRQLSK